MIAAHYACAHLPRVAGVALLASALNLSPHRGIRPWLIVRNLARLAAKSPRLARIVQPANKLVMTRVLGFHPRFSSEELFHGWCRVSFLDFEQHARMCETLRAANMPVLVAWTKDDRLIEASLARRTAEALPQSGPRLEFETGGHMLVKTRAREISQSIEKWMRAW